jgi:hypothetical protein
MLLRKWPAWLFAAACAVGTACSHDPPVAKPDPAEKPPLPPSSGTPVGYLVDAAGDLKLTDDQVTKLKGIDEALAARLEALASQARAASKPADSGDSPPPQPMGGRHGGRGMRGGGMGGGGRPHRSHAQGSGAGGGAGVARIDNERAAEVKDALQRAFAILDDAQQTAAKKLLADHDVDVDTGDIAPASAATEAGEP